MTVTQTQALDADAAFASAYLDSLSGLLKEIDPGPVAEAVAMLRRARDTGRTVYTCGNGGSASIASELVVDLLKGASFGRPSRFRVIGLPDSIATVTAYANDVDYGSVFVEPLKNFAEPGDVLIAISGSGNSENVVRAVAYANSVGCHTIGITTSRGGRLGEAARLVLGVPGGHMGRLEDCFYAITHVLAYAFIEDC